MFDLQAAADLKKKRTFRKFTYRGVDLDQLLDMNNDQLTELLPCRIRQFLLLFNVCNRLVTSSHILGESSAEAWNANPWPWSRSCARRRRLAFPMKNLVRSLISCDLDVKCVAFKQPIYFRRCQDPSQRHGNCARDDGIHGRGIQRQNLQPGWNQARNDWTLSGWILHHLQASETRSPRYRRYPLFTFHPTEVILCASSRKKYSFFSVTRLLFGFI